MNYYLISLDLAARWETNSLSRIENLFSRYSLGSVLTLTFDFLLGVRISWLALFICIEVIVFINLFLVIQFYNL